VSLDSHIGFAIIDIVTQSFTVALQIVIKFNIDLFIDIDIGDHFIGSGA